MYKRIYTYTYIYIYIYTHTHSCSGLMGDKFFSLSLMLVGGQIGDLCNDCFVGDFALLGVVCFRVVDCMCVFVWTTTLDLPHSQPVAELVLGKIRQSVVVSGATETLANHSLPTGSIAP